MPVFDDNLMFAKALAMTADGDLTNILTIRGTPWDGASVRAIMTDTSGSANSCILTPYASDNGSTWVSLGTATVDPGALGTAEVIIPVKTEKLQIKVHVNLTGNLTITAGYTLVVPAGGWARTIDWT